VESLGELGHGVTEVTAGLLTASRDSYDLVRIAAARSLGQLGQGTPEVATTLLADLYDSDDFVRILILESLGELGQATPEVIADLLADLRDSDNFMRLCASKSLVQLGKRNRKARQSIVSHLLAVLEGSGAVNNEAYTVLLQLASLGNDDSTARPPAA
jgi:HEAT repeat protein